MRLRTGPQRRIHRVVQRHTIAAVGDSHRLTAHPARVRLGGVSALNEAGSYGLALTHHFVMRCAPRLGTPSRSVVLNCGRPDNPEARLTALQMATDMCDSNELDCSPYPFDVSRYNEIFSFSSP